MHLLHMTTLTLQEFYEDIPPYAILSHTWGAEEVLFSDFGSDAGNEKAGWSKVYGMCHLARHEFDKKLDWVWIDTCCIDKSNAVELQEAINSMFKYYSEAGVCVAFLKDVMPDADMDAFARARWWQRGWTLQELVAPREVFFYAADMQTRLCTKTTQWQLVSRISGLPRSVLLNPKMCFHQGLGRRLSWAAERKCTKQEDKVYCLLGLLDISIPVLYGEGPSRAFTRLQEELIRTTMDETIFAWQYSEDSRGCSSAHDVLAPALLCFRGTGRYIPSIVNNGLSTYSMINGKLRISRKLLVLKQSTWNWSLSRSYHSRVGPRVTRREFFLPSEVQDPIGNSLSTMLKSPALCKKIEAVRNSTLTVFEGRSQLTRVQFSDHELYDIEALKERGARISKNVYELLIS